MKWYYDLLVSSLKESLIFAGACALVALAGVYVLSVPFFNGLGLVLLIASAGLMLVGGAMSFVSPGNVKLVNALSNAKLKPSIEDYRRTRNKAALYALTGIFLFAYSLTLAEFML